MLKTSSAVEMNTLNAKKKKNECKTIPKHLIIPTNTYFCFKFHAPIKILQSLGISRREGVLVILRFLSCNLPLTLDESSYTMMTEMSTTPTQMTCTPSSSVVASAPGETHLVAVL